MELIEQAVCLSAASERPGEGRRMAISAGVSDDDAREIIAWAPAEEDLLAEGEGSTGLYFHPLPSGAYAIGRTTAVRRHAGPHNAPWASTHCLIARPRLLARFAGNPLALLRAAQAADVSHRHEELPNRLDAIPIDGRSPIVDTLLMSQLCLHPGADWMAALVQAAIDSPRTAVVDGERPEDIVAGILNCLPPECRVQMTFSVGLRFCARRPYRLAVLPCGSEEKQRMERLYNMTVLDLAERAPEPMAPIGSWGSLVHRVLRARRISFFAGQLARRPLEFSAEDLPALALQILEELDASAVDDRKDETSVPDTEDGPAERWEKQALAGDDEHGARRRGRRSRSKPSARGRGRRGSRHAAHARRPANVELSAASVARPTPPSKRLDPNDPAVLAKLERLDDLVFEAVGGKQASLEELRDYWPQVRRDLGDPLLAESREQYLRYAVTSWERLAQRDVVRDPSFAMQSLEVLSVLFGGAME